MDGVGTYLRTPAILLLLLLLLLYVRSNYRWRYTIHH